MGAVGGGGGVCELEVSARDFVVERWLLTCCSYPVCLEVVLGTNVVLTACSSITS